VGQKPILPNPHQPLGDDVQGEPAQEFHRLQRHLLALTTISIVLPGEADPIVLELHQTVIAQGDTVGVPRQVLQDLFRPAKRRHCILPIITSKKLLLSILITRCMANG
jgi:hypothetical protein